MESVIYNLIGETIGTSTLISTLALIIGAYIFIKKSNLENKTSAGTIQERQLNVLYDEVHKLNKELGEARRELNDIHGQNMKLLEEIAMANIRIKELEVTLNHLTLANESLTLSGGRARRRGDKAKDDK